MSARTLLALPLILTGALIAPSFASAAPAASSSPKALSLTLHDVQHVYGATFRPFMTNIYKASKYKTCGADMTGSYLTIFGNFAKGAKGSGVTSVESTVTSYPSTQSSACALKATGTLLIRMKKVPGSTIKESSLSGLGDSAVVFNVTTVMKASGKNAYTLEIWMARGTHVAMVTVSAVGARPALSGAVALTKIIDARIGASG